MSKWCRNCNTSKSSEKSKHIKKHQCSCNHQGSAGSMEPVGAYRLFERSRETRKLQYVEFYGDGDSKSHLAVKDIYGIDSLCDQNLLRKCLHGKTQNANEAFNGCLWNVVPKEIFVELQTFSLGSYIAVITFNKGFKGLLSVLEALDIKIGSYTLRGYAAIDQTRIKDSKRHSLPSAKLQEKKIRAIKREKLLILKSMKLDNANPGHWIGRQGPVLWPPASPDLTTLYFFLWGHLKELVYRYVVTTQIDLVARLHISCTSLDPAVLRHAMTSIARRALACLDMHGGHFEHLP
ncbi:uncharacterized protein TNCV_290441 [Trichonephila clavipes]|nr:uncharacterized protein TNCV_290441 [Trichonephila clavipes]